MKKTVILLGILLALAGCSSSDSMHTPSKNAVHPAMSSSASSQSIFRYKDYDLIPETWTYQKISGMPFELPLPQDSKIDYLTIRTREDDNDPEFFEIFFHKAPDSILKIEEYPSGLCYSLDRNPNKNHNLPPPSEWELKYQIEGIEQNTSGIRMMKFKQVDCGGAFIPVYAFEYRNQVFGMGLIDKGYGMRGDLIEKAMANLRSTE